MLLPAAVLILLAVSINAVPHIRSIAQANAGLFLNQSGYAQAALDKVAPTVPTELLKESSYSSLISTSLAGLLSRS